MKSHYSYKLKEVPVSSYAPMPHLIKALRSNSTASVLQFTSQSCVVALKQTTCPLLLCLYVMKVLESSKQYIIAHTHALIPILSYLLVTYPYV